LIPDGSDAGRLFRLGGSRGLIVGLLLAIWLVAAWSMHPSVAYADDEQQDFSLSKLGVAGEILGLIPADLDGDSLLDIVIVHKKGLPPNESRWVSIFWQSANGTYGTAPDQSWELDTLATIVDVGNVVPDPSREICYLTAAGVWYYKLTDHRYSESGTELFGCSAMTVFPSKSQVPTVDFVRDWDGRPGDEVAVFGFDGLDIYKPDSTGKFGNRSVMHMDLETHLRTSTFGTDRERVSGVHAGFQFPDLTVADYNGDGRADITATLEDRLQVFLQASDGSFSRQPAASVNFDVRTPEEKQEGNAELRTMVADLNNDGFADAVVTKMTAKGLSSFRSVISLFWGRALGYPTVPDQVIVSEGSASAEVTIRDVNGDGNLDLIMPSMHISIAAIIRILITRNVPITYNIFLCHDGPRYPDRPDFEKEVNYKIDLSGESDTQAMTLDGDFNGDKIRDFVLATGDDELSVYLGSKGNSRDLFAKKPVSKVTADAFGDLIAEDLNHDGASDMLLRYPNTKDKKGFVEVLMNRRTIK
jgi:hypothetical protein